MLLLGKAQSSLASRWDMACLSDAAVEELYRHVRDINAPLAAQLDGEGMAWGILSPVLLTSERSYARRNLG